MDHASQMAAARELRASFSGQSSKSSRRPVGRSGGRNAYDVSASPLYRQPALGRQAMPQPRSATGASVSAPVGTLGSSSQIVPPHLRSSVGRNTEQTTGVAQSNDTSGSVAANPSRAIPPHLRGPIVHAPQQLAGSTQPAPSQAVPLQTVPPHLRAPADSATQQPAGTGGSGEGPNSDAKSQTGNNQATDNAPAFPNALGGLQNSRYAQDTRPTHSSPLAQKATLEGTEAAKKIVSADNNNNPPVVGQSIGQHTRCSAQDLLLPHQRQFVRGPTHQPSGADTAADAQGGSAIFNFPTGGTQANDVFKFQAEQSQTSAGRPHELQNSQFAKAAQSPTSSTLEAINVTALRANSAANAGSHSPVNHLPNTAGGGSVRGHGGLKDSRFALPTSLPKTLLTAPNTATKSYDNHFGSTGSGVKSQDGQQRHVDEYTTFPVTAKEVTAFVPTSTEPVAAPSTTRPGLMTPEPDNKGDDFSGDIEMLDIGRDPMVGNATKHTHGGVLQSRWAPQAAPAAKTLEGDKFGYRRPEPTWQLARLVHPTPTPARFDPSREHKPLEGATLQGLGQTVAKQSHANQSKNVDKSAFGGLASSRFA